MCRQGPPVAARKRAWLDENRCFRIDPEQRTTTDTNPSKTRNVSESSKNISSGAISFKSHAFGCLQYTAQIAFAHGICSQILKKSLYLIGVLCLDVRFFPSPEHFGFEDVPGTRATSILKSTMLTTRPLARTRSEVILMIFGDLLWRPKKTRKCYETIGRRSVWRASRC